MISEINFKDLGIEEDIKFATYGSYKNGLGTKNSDVDSTVLTNSFIPER